MDFNLEYEALLKNLKYEFLTCKQWELYRSMNHMADVASAARLGALQENFSRHRFELQQFIRRHFDLFDTRHVSSLLGVPTQPIGDDERLVHRIWMGGPLPDLAREAMRQWECAIDEAGSEYDSRYTSILWVWDQKQLRHDPHFSPAPAPAGSAYRIGSYLVGAVRHPVHGLRALALDLAPCNFELIKALHAQAYFVNLADYFRLLILQEHGGIYMDADTIPHRSATLFLSKPEVPDYIDFHRDAQSGKMQQCFVSWMNLIKDENGMLVAKKGNPAVRRMVERINDNLAGMSALVPDKRRQPVHASAYATLLHDATYGVWRQDIGRSFLDYDELEKRYSVLHAGKPETIISGLSGMRLVVDALTNAAVPLSEQEQRSYDRCVGALEQLDWRLDNILDLERIAEVCYVDEVPRMAYAPQLRAQPESCHYYSFLSKDDKLDRINALFAAYLTTTNAQRINDGDFWCKTRGRGHQDNYHSRISTYAGVSYLLNPATPHIPLFLC